MGDWLYALIVARPLSTHRLLQAGLDTIPGQTGYLVISSEGAVLQVRDTTELAYIEP